MAAVERQVPALSASDALTSALGFIRADAELQGDRWVAELCLPVLERAAADGLFGRRRAAEDASAGHIASFTLFCERLLITDPLATPADGLAQAVTRWLSWLAGPISASDPMLCRTRPTKGLRRSTEPLVNVTVHLASVADHLARAGRADVNLDQARAFAKAHGRKHLPRKAYPLGPGHVRTLVGALTDGSVADVLVARNPATSRETAELWCLRETAALLVSFWGGLRVSERRKLVDARTVITDEALTSHMARTKQHPEGRTVHLWPRVELCPIAAVAAFLSRCAELGVDRTGLLLPPIKLSAFPQIRTGPAEDGLRIAASVAGLGGFDMDPTRHYLANHSLRRGIASALAAKGTDLEVIRQHLGHLNVHTTGGYTDVVAAGTIDHKELGL